MESSKAKSLNKPSSSSKYPRRHGGVHVPIQSAVSKAKALLSTGSHDFKGFSSKHLERSSHASVCSKNFIYAKEKEEKELEESIFSIEGLTCSECRLTFSSEAHLQTHKKFCGRSNALSPGRTDLGEEHEELLQEAQSGMFACPWCPLLLSTMDGVRKHLLSCREEKLQIRIKKKFNKTLLCPECSKEFSFLKHLLVHLQVHYLGDVICRPCNMAFQCIDSLLEHLYICTSKGPFKCSDCSEQFSNASTFQDHLMVCKSFLQCLKCSEVIIERISCMNHMMSHLEDYWAEKGQQLINGVLHRTSEQDKLKDRVPAKNFQSQVHSVSPSNKRYCKEEEFLSYSATDKFLKSKESSETTKPLCGRKQYSSEKLGGTDVSSLVCTTSQLSTVCKESILPPDSKLKGNQRSCSSSNLPKFDKLEKIGDSPEALQHFDSADNPPDSSSNDSSDEDTVSVDGDALLSLDNEVYEIENDPGEVDFENGPSDIVDQFDSSSRCGNANLNELPTFGPTQKASDLFVPASVTENDGTEDKLTLTVVNVEGGANHFGWDDCEVVGDASKEADCQEESENILNEATQTNVSVPMSKDNDYAQLSVKDANEDKDSGIDATEDGDSNGVAEDLEVCREVTVSTSKHNNELQCTQEPESNPKPKYSVLEEHAYALPALPQFMLKHSNPSKSMRQSANAKPSKNSLKKVKKANTSVRQTSKVKSSARSENSLIATSKAPHQVVKSSQNQKLTSYITTSQTGASPTSLVHVTNDADGRVDESTQNEASLAETICVNHTEKEPLNSSGMGKSQASGAVQTISEHPSIMSASPLTAQKKSGYILQQPVIPSQPEDVIRNFIPKSVKLLEAPHQLTAVRTKAVYVNINQAEVNRFLERRKSKPYETSSKNVSDLNTKMRKREQSMLARGFTPMASLLPQKGHFSIGNPKENISAGLRLPQKLLGVNQKIDSVSCQSMLSQGPDSGMAQLPEKGKVSVAKTTLEVSKDGGLLRSPDFESKSHHPMSNPSPLSCDVLKDKSAPFLLSPSNSVSNDFSLIELAESLVSLHNSQPVPSKLAQEKDLFNCAKAELSFINDQPPQSQSSNEVFNSTNSLSEKPLPNKEIKVHSTLVPGKRDLILPEPAMSQSVFGVSHSEIIRQTESLMFIVSSDGTLLPHPNFTPPLEQKVASTMKSMPSSIIDSMPPLRLLHNHERNSSVSLNSPKREKGISSFENNKMKDSRQAILTSKRILQDDPHEETCTLSGKVKNHLTSAAKANVPTVLQSNLGPQKSQDCQKAVAIEPPASVVKSTQNQTEMCQNYKENKSSIRNNTKAGVLKILQATVPDLAKYNVVFMCSDDDSEEEELTTGTENCPDVIVQSLKTNKSPTNIGQCVKSVDIVKSVEELVSGEMKKGQTPRKPVEFDCFHRASTCPAGLATDQKSCEVEMVNKKEADSVNFHVNNFSMKHVKCPNLPNQIKVTNLFNKVDGETTASNEVQQGNCLEADSSKKLKESNSLQMDQHEVDICNELDTSRNGRSNSTEGEARNCLKEGLGQKLCDLLKECDETADIHLFNRCRFDKKQNFKKEIEARNSCEGESGKVWVKAPDECDKVKDAKQCYKSEICTGEISENMKAEFRKSIVDHGMKLVESNPPSLDQYDIVDMDLSSGCDTSDKENSDSCEAGSKGCFEGSLGKKLVESPFKCGGSRSTNLCDGSRVNERENSNNKVEARHSVLKGIGKELEEVCDQFYERKDRDSCYGSDHNGMKEPEKKICLPETIKHVEGVLQKEKKLEREVVLNSESLASSDLGETCPKLNKEHGESIVYNRYEADDLLSDGSMDMDISDFSEEEHVNEDTCLKNPGRSHNGRKNLLSQFQSSFHPSRRIMMEMTSLERRKFGREGRHKTVKASILRCSDCSQLFSSQLDLKVHRCMRMILKDKFCSAAFDRFFDLDQNVKDEQNTSEILRSETPNEDLSPLENYLRMKTLKKSRRFVCVKCSQGFRSFSALLGHRKSLHSESSSLSCHMCPKEFDNLQKLAVHFAKSHKSKAKEDHIKVSKVSSEMNLINFSSKPTPNGIEKTSWCGKNDQLESSTLHKEKIAASEDTDIFAPSNAVDGESSEVVGDARNRCEALREEELIKIEDNSSANYCCECKKKFKSRGGLKSHMNQAHSTIRCPVCSKRFTFHKSLETHLRENHAPSSSVVPAEEVKAGTSTACLFEQTYAKVELLTSSNLPQATPFQSTDDCENSVVKESLSVSDTKLRNNSSSGIFFHKKKHKRSKWKIITESSSWRKSNLITKTTRPLQKTMDTPDVEKKSVQQGLIEAEHPRPLIISLCKVRANRYKCHSCPEIFKKKSHLSLHRDKVHNYSNFSSGFVNTSTLPMLQPFEIETVNEVEAPPPCTGESDYLSSGSVQKPKHLLPECAAPDVDQSKSENNKLSADNQSSSQDICHQSSSLENLSSPQDSRISSEVTALKLDAPVSSGLINQDRRKTRFQAFTETLRKDIFKTPAPKKTKHHERAWKCDQCQKVFRLKGFLERHNIEHHSAPCNFNCLLCGKMFTEYRTLRFHHKTKHKKKKWISPCSNTPSLESSGQSHPIPSYNKAVSIDSADSSLPFDKPKHSSEFKTASEISVSDFSPSTSVEESKLLEPVPENNRLSSPDEKVNSTLKESNNLLTSQKSEVLSNRHESESTINPHDLNKSSDFEVLSKVTTVKEEGGLRLKRKLDLVLEKDVYKCADCHLTYKVFSCLKRHRILVHGEETKFRCSICGKGFSYPHSLKNHVMGHSQGHKKLKRSVRRLMKEQIKNGIELSSVETDESTSMSEKSFDFNSCLPIVQDDCKSKSENTGNLCRQENPSLNDAIHSSTSDVTENHGCSVINNVFDGQLCSKIENVCPETVEVPSLRSINEKENLMSPIETSGKDHTDKIIAPIDINLLPRTLQFSPLRKGFEKENEVLPFHDNFDSFNNPNIAQPASQDTPFLHGPEISDDVSFSTLSPLGTLVPVTARRDNEWGSLSFHNPRTYSMCAICGLNFSSWFALQEHHFTTHSYPSYPNDTLPQATMSSYPTLHGFQTVHSGWHSPLEPHHTSTSNNFTRVMEDSGSLQELTSHSVAHCSVCGMCFPSLFSLQEHYATHLIPPFSNQASYYNVFY